MPRRAVLLITIVAAAAVTIAAVAWMMANPFPSYWDEAVYFVNASHDFQAVHAGGLRGFVLTFIAEDRWRPPALRLFALPFTLAIGPRLLVMRVVSFAGFLAAIGLMAWAVRRSVSLEAASVAALIALTSPMLILSTKVFGTEYPLLLASALLLCFLTAASRFRWIGIGIALGIGALAKASFALIGGPMVIAIIFLAAMKRKRGEPARLPSPVELAAAIALGGAIALLWWGPDFSSGVHFASISRVALRHSLGPPSTVTFVRWAYEFARCDAGWASAAVILILFFFGRWSADPLLVVALAGAIPQIVASAIGPNHNPRYVAPSVLMLAAAAGVVGAPLLRKWQASSAILVLLLVQVALVSLPLRSTQSFIWRGATEVNAPVEQWDFVRVKNVVDRLGAPSHPRIAVLGVGYAMNPPQLEAAWIRAGSDAPVRALWGADREPFDVRRTIERALTAEIVVTAPGFRGDPSDQQPRDNEYNALFARALPSTGQFAGPFIVDVGVRQPAKVALFVRRTSARAR